MADSLERLTAALSGRYSIARELGAGGMATVYLAEDLKHNRKVAIKVLKPELAAVLGAERFVAEIRTTAALQHPNILPLHDSGEADGLLYYVMPYVEGESLRDKLDRETQLGIDQSVQLVREVADALDYAHRHGVVHRDIKPENILLHDGRPMVADFGIALAVSAAAGGRMTETGLSLGTPHYMSPEQATAEKNITGKSDVYSLASVLYEMLTGDPPHTGKSAQQIIAKIVTEAPAPVDKLRRSVPPNVAAAVSRALEKLPADRFESAKAFADALTNPAFRHATVAGIDGRGVAATTGVGGDAGEVRRWKRVSVVLGAVATLAVAVLVVALLRSTRPVPRVAWHTTLELPDTAPLGMGFDLSRDGSVVVWSSVHAARGRLWMRRAAALSVAPIRGTEAAVWPRISPDGRRVAFLNVTKGMVEVIAPEGGTPIQVGLGAVSTAVVWTDDEHVAFVAPDGSIMQAAVGSGAETRLLSADGVAGSPYLRVQDALPDHGGLIVVEMSGSMVPDSGRIAVAGPGDGAFTVLTPGVSARYAPVGRLIVTRADGSIVAFSFDPAHRRITGPARPFVTGAQSGLYSTGGVVAVSADGHLVYAMSGGFGLKGALMHVTLSGIATPVNSGWSQSFYGVALSPDGGRMATEISAAAGTGEQIAILDIANGSVSHVSVPGGTPRSPVFTPDGRSVIFTGPQGLYRAPVSGGTPERIWGPRRSDSTAAPIEVANPSLTADGRSLYFSAYATDGPSEIRVISLDSLDTPGHLVAAGGDVPQVSPDGRWLTYFTVTAGTWQVRVRSTDPSRDEEWRIAPEARPFSWVRWSRDGRELYYMTQDSLYAAHVEAGSTFKVTSTRALFPAAQYWQGFDILPNGDFVMIRQLNRSTTELHMIDDIGTVLGQ